MTELFPEPPPSTRYSKAFEDCWKVHMVGNKKAAWNAGKKARWTDANWVWLMQYLERRHKDDELWVKGARDSKTGETKKYIPHLSSIINGERWNDNYKKIKRDRFDRVNEQREESGPRNEALAAAALQGIRKNLGMRVH